MKGYINSVETMGMVDGPGIRFVVFMQGCHLRCLYCHNPETWSLSGGIEITPQDLVKQILNYKNYFGNDGGVTFSGGEPLLQPEFLIQTMKLCHKHGIHVCLDTAGYGTEKDEEVLKNVDLIILDVKASNNNLYKKITGKDITQVDKFINLCNKMNKPIWIRQVIVPGINDTKENILDLKKYLKKINNIKLVELLPYHTYGKEKYKKLGISYRLKNIEDMNVEKIKELNKLLKD